MRRWASSLLLAAAFSLGSFPIQASPITYIVTTTATGTLGGTPFTNAGFIVTLTGDTSEVVPVAGGFSLANPGAATVIIPGLGAATFTDSMAAVSTLNTPFDGLFAVGVGDETQGTLISFAEGSQLQGYDLASPLSFSGSGGLGNGGGPGNIFPTSGGDLEFARDQPPPLESASVTAITTQTLTGYQGGTTSAPVFLVGSDPIGQLTGTISGLGAEDYYWFYWGGGAFAATASVTGASGGASYLFSAGAAGACSTVGSQTLNSGDGFAATISDGNLAAGQYCIGLDANSANDPAFSLTFDTPVSVSPEPGAFLLLSGGLGAIAAARFAVKRAS